MGKRRRKGKWGGRSCFVTGYPSLVTRRLVYELLARERECTVTALVREKFVAEAKTYISKYLSPDMQKRLSVVTGDIVNMHLGLSSDEYTLLIENTTDVYHLATISYRGVDEKTMRLVNVYGTRNMLEFADDCRNLSRFNYFSTCFVSGDRVGVIREEELDSGQRFRNAFERTKYEAELLVRHHSNKTPISIYRPSIVIGDSRTGEIDRFSEPYYIAIAMIGSPIRTPLPLVGDGSAPLNIVPADYVVRAMHKLSQIPETVGKTFHLADSNPLSVRQVYEIIALKMGKKLPLYHIPRRIAKLAFRLPGLEKYFPSPLRAIDYIDHLAIYSTTNTMKFLMGTGIICPSFEEYVDNLIGFVQNYYEEKRHKRAEDGLTDQLA
ncbi:MAG: hypothetical protein Kow0090_17560 [Myxococcota bacterium]